MYKQILAMGTQQNVWGLVTRICILILGLKGLTRVEMNADKLLASPKNQGLDSQSPPKIRCFPCIVAKQKPIVKKQYLGFIRT